MAKKLVGGGPRRMSLKDLLETNPLILLVSAAISASTIVAGVMTYVTNARLDGVEAQHKAELLELRNKDRAELLDTTQSLKAKIEDLTYRMSSIERRLPGAGPAFLDVSAVIIPPDARNSLNSRYKSFDNDGFFVAVPDEPAWTYQRTNELAFLRSMYSFLDTVIAKAPQFQAVSKAELFVWKNKNGIKIRAKESTSPDSDYFTFYPAITVEHIDQNLLYDRAQMIGNYVSAANKMAENIAKAEAIKFLDKTKSEASKSKVPEGTPDVAKSVSQTLAKSDLKQEIIEYLDKIGTSDIANYEFIETVVQALIQMENFPIKHKFLSAQKKGNAFYVQDQLSFRNIEVQGEDGNWNHANNVNIDEEVFFFSKGADGYLIKIFLPPVSNRAENFAWTKSWLTGLQIPLE